MRSMHCTVCGGERLLAKVSFSLFAPLAAKGGSIKLSGLKFTQLDIKKSWDIDPSTESVKTIRGPIYCDDCGTEFIYVLGSSKPLQTAGENNE